METILLGKYELLEQLGRGGYGTVYRARESVLDVPRAVKVLHPPLAADPAFIERFRRETQLAARLEHPNIVPVYELGEQQGRFYLAMKYMPGGSLKERLAKDGRLPYEQALAVLRQVAAGLHYANTQPAQLVHRDVKPGNILFEADGTVRLADFGFAKALAEADKEASSSSGGMIGTPAYMPPEVWRGGAYGPGGDVYSLACMFYEMLTGVVLFEGDSPAEVMTRHVLDGPQFPQEWPEGVPESVEAVLRRALARDVEVRYADSLGFVEALRNFESLMISSVSSQYVTNLKSSTLQESIPKGENQLVDSDNASPIKSNALPMIELAVSPQVVDSVAEFESQSKIVLPEASTSIINQPQNITSQERVVVKSKQVVLPSLIMALPSAISLALGWGLSSLLMLISPISIVFIPIIQTIVFGWVLAKIKWSMDWKLYIFLLGGWEFAYISMTVCIYTLIKKDPINILTAIPFLLIACVCRVITPFLILSWMKFFYSRSVKIVAALGWSSLLILMWGTLSLAADPRYADWGPIMSMAGIIEGLLAGLLIFGLATNNRSER